LTRRVTLKDVANQAGVSYQTVSKVVNKQIRISKSAEDRIWEAVHALGYRPNHIARSLRSQSTKMIGYSWEPTPPDQFNPILEQFLQSMVQVAEVAGYHILAFPFRPGDEWLNLYRELIDTNRVDGFVISSVNFDDPRIILFQEQNFPFVAFGRSNPEYVFPYVDVDGGAGMCQVVEHLLKQGHRRIYALAWPEDSRVGQNRLDGFLDALKQAGINPEEDWIVRGEGTFQFGQEASGRWLDQPKEQRPTAIVALNDNMAIGAMSAAHQRGLQVGKDLAVTGFDDVPMAQYITPPLTSVRQPIRNIGQLIMAMLLEIVDNKTPENKQILIQPKLIIRESSEMYVS
jgi:DNA-binding LacI/PurR family transcriptional regulator